MDWILLATRTMHILDMLHLKQDVQQIQQYKHYYLTQNIPPLTVQLVQQ